MHEIGVRHTAEWFGLTFNVGTLEMTWITMAVVLFIAFMATRGLKAVPGRWQAFLEIVYDGLADQIDGSMGKKGKSFAPFLVTLFLFILISNWVGLVPTMESPTNDLNTTLGLAIMVVIFVHIVGVSSKGMGYIKHFFQPFAPFVIINIIEEIAKPVTLAFRLFGNILAGEILIVILLMLVPVWMPVPSVIWLAFSLFVGVIQAFIFTMLSMSYLANAVNDHHE